MELVFDRGSLVWTGSLPSCVAEYFCPDPRIRAYRAEAHHYAAIARQLSGAKISFTDTARAYEKTPFAFKRPIAPRPHQSEGLAAWLRQGGRGVVVLPTGAGKSLLAVLAIQKVGRPALIAVPTLDLLAQWTSLLEAHFEGPIGMVGGGSRAWQALTVATYDSAALAIESVGNRFGFLIADECHHLPGPTYRQIAALAIAPYRLGLTATPERPDGEDAALYTLLGPLAHRVEIHALEGDYLAPYRVERLFIPLTPDERTRYEAARKIYRAFLAARGLKVRSIRDWQHFILLASRSKDGRAALAAYREQKALTRASQAKFDVLFSLLKRHCEARILIFTDDNKTAYAIGQAFALPVITHQTKAIERKALLAYFKSGDLPVLVSSKVLNEGVDVPEASVGIVLSGSGSVREHVQRLGRILRKAEGKQATLYELVSEDTGEEKTSERRREHRAYDRTIAL